MHGRPESPRAAQPSDHLALHALSTRATLLTRRRACSMSLPRRPCARAACAPPSPCRAPSRWRSGRRPPGRARVAAKEGTRVSKRAHAGAERKKVRRRHGRDERAEARPTEAKTPRVTRTCSMLTAASSRSRAASASRSTCSSAVMLAMAFEALAESSSFCSTKSVTLDTSAPSRLLPEAASSSVSSSG